MTFLITAGPTREAIDPVRYLTNRSSGKMGYALAGAAAHEGHRVILISGPTSLDVPDHVDFIAVESAIEMYDAVKSYIHKADIAIFAAAVADYRPAHLAAQKIKKNAETITLELVKNPDILGSAREEFHFTGVLIGFAAETENVITNAREKLHRKQCDIIVANDVSRSDIGFDSSENEVLIVTADTCQTLEKADKHQIAIELIRHITPLAKAR